MLKEYAINPNELTRQLFNSCSIDPRRSYIASCNTLSLNNSQPEHQMHVNLMRMPASRAKNHCTNLVTNHPKLAIYQYAKEPVYLDLDDEAYNALTTVPTLLVIDQELQAKQGEFLLNCKQNIVVIDALIIRCYSRILSQFMLTQGTIPDELMHLPNIVKYNKDLHPRTLLKHIEHKRKLTHQLLHPTATTPSLFKPAPTKQPEPITDTLAKITASFCPPSCPCAISWISPKTTNQQNLAYTNLNNQRAADTISEILTAAGYSTVIESFKSAKKSRKKTKTIYRLTVTAAPKSGLML